MASSVTQWVTSCTNIVLSVTALCSSYTLFKDHRAPSVGLFLLGLSAAACVLQPSSSQLTALQREAEWAGELLAPALVSFDFLWLSQDHNTAHILLCGSCLLLGLCDWLSADAFSVMTCCLGLSSLSCCLMVGTNTLALLMSPAASEGLMKWVLKGALSIGCWASTRALGKFLLDVTDQCNISI
ncbi:unnamed protein product [Pleuronectes platessa]|uniref:Uncharacterized protein n=1 Tax=Pleuronectes platessa TaxID=8262 RepID=A0A9N7UCA7_PLEPL|nr:unnamed protein product [Pleuronectes platessa]